jgi:ribonuclease P protein subunit RPR2
MGRRINKTDQQKIARKRIMRLFAFAEKQAKRGKISHAHRAVGVARRIAMKATISLPKEYKQVVCKHCYHYLYPSVTCRVRIGDGKKTITCFHCHERMRYPYNP